MEGWPPVLPVFSLLTPFPSTPLYKRLLEGGRLTKRKHWLDFRPFTRSFIPDKISMNEAEMEVREAWTLAYSPGTTREAMRKISDPPLSERAVVFFARLAFRGIYFPQVRRRQWLSLLWNNRYVLLSLCYEALHTSRSTSPPDSIEAGRKIA